jgi:hypothetical protein
MPLQTWVEIELAPLQLYYPKNNQSTNVLTRKQRIPNEMILYKFRGKKLSPNFELTKEESFMYEWKNVRLPPFILVINKYFF